MKYQIQDVYKKMQIAPRAIILEGPAGAGKTTLMKFLQKKLVVDGLNIGILPEFSNNEFGQLIEANCQYGQKKPKWLDGFGGLWIFLADRINQIEQAIDDKEKIWICDRFITSQFVLGLRMIEKEVDKRFARKIIHLISEWAFNKVAKKSLILFLDASINILQERLERRIARKLNTQELKLLNAEILQYHYLALSMKKKNALTIHTNDSINIVGEKAIELIYSEWHL